MEKINSGSSEPSLFPEYEFIVSCLRIGLKIEDLRLLTYVDVLKILISYIKPQNSTKNSRSATQNDIDRLLG